MTKAWAQRSIGSTAGTFLGLLAIGALPHIDAFAAQPIATQFRWTGKNESSTSGRHAGPISGTYAIADRAFEIELAQAYESFAARQKPLEPEFANILVANLWNLYER